METGKPIMQHGKFKIFCCVLKFKEKKHINSMSTPTVNIIIITSNSFMVYVFALALVFATFFPLFYLL